MKNLVLVILVMSIYSVSAQETVLRFPVNLNEKAGAFSIVDEETGNLAILAKDGKRLYGFLFNKDFEEIGAVEIEKLPVRYQTLTGFFNSPEELHLLFGNYSRNKFAIATFDFNEKTGNFEKLDVRLRKEGFIGAFSNSEKFSVLSIPIDSDVIRLYELEKNSSPVVKEMNFENQKFLDQNNRPVKLYQVFSEKEEFLIPAKIVADVPNPLLVTSKKIKLYEFDDEIVISIDSNDYFTFLLNINPENLAVKVNSIKKPHLKDRKTSNSLWFEDKLFQTVANKEGLAFQVYDLKEREVVKNFSTGKNQKIPFKNTPIIQNNGPSSSVEKIDTQKFLRKVNDLIGITALKKEGFYHISLGTPLGYSEEKSVDLDFVVLNATGNNFSESFSANNYALSRTIEFSSVFNEDFEHIEIEGGVESDFFQKIRSYARDQEDIYTETVFKKNGEFYWGFYSSIDSKYQILKIE